VGKSFFYCEQDYTDNKFRLRKFGRNGSWLEEIPFRPYCYIYGVGNSEFKDAINHKSVKKIEFDNPSNIGLFKSDNLTLESDIPYERRAMLDMDWKIDDVPKVYVDIETNDSHGAPDPNRDEILSVGMIFDDGREEWLHGDEKKMLQEFINLTANVGMMITYNGGTDVWSTRSFDIPYIARRYGKQFEFDNMLRHCAFMDIYQIYKYETSRVGKALAGGMSLDNVAVHELGHGKIRRDKKIYAMPKNELRDYNMNDVRILKEIDEKFQFTDVKIGLAQLTNLNLCAWRRNKKVDELKPLIMVDQLVLKEGKNLGLVWHDRQFSDEESITGAMVLEPIVGVHQGVQNFDVRQMYPNIMINEKISPDKDRIVVPNILMKLKAIREELKEKYKKTKSKEDYINQYGYKVLANVFYGAIGNPACRIYDRSLAQAVTSKGQEILGRVREMCELAGFSVVYGDTDSIFAKIEKSKSESLLGLINNMIKPYEMEAGEYYTRILFLGDMEGEKIIGAKKRYAGITDEGEMKTVGVQSIRRDYCVIAREMQLLALNKVLNGKSEVDLQTCMNNLRKVLPSKIYDSYLVITKGVKNLGEYKLKTKTGKESKGQPHIRALRMAVEKGFQNMFDISFVYTKKDVEPILVDGIFPDDIDYEKYYESQVVAVVEPIIKSIQLQNGTYVIKEKSRKRKTINQSLLEHLSS